MSSTACDDQLTVHPDDQEGQKTYSLPIAGNARNEMIACGCVGPQNGDPVCPCQMRNVTIVNGKRAIVRFLD